MRKIMLVDDMDIFNFIMKKLIEAVNPIHQVHDFTNGQQALDCLDELDPDVVLLDLNMPVMDGWQFLDTLKERNLPCKVYILTSSTSGLDRQRSADYTNVVDFLIKPVGEEKLAEILEAV